MNHPKPVHFVLLALPIATAVAPRASAQCIEERLCFEELVADNGLAVSGARIAIALETTGGVEPTGFVYSDFDDAAPQPLFSSQNAGLEIRRVAFSGTSVALGVAPGAGVPLGQVLIFEEQAGGGWSETVVLSGAQPEFGRVLDLDGERLIAGGGGSLQVYERGANGWMETAEIPIGATLRDAELEGDRVAVWGNANLSPEFSTYLLSPSGWELESQVALAGETLELSASLALQGARAFASRPRLTSNADQVFEFAQGANGWELVDAIPAPADEPARALFGASLDVRGGRLAVGSPVVPGAQGVLPLVPGTAYTYRSTDGSWEISGEVQLPSAQPGEEQLGAALAFHPAGLAAATRGQFSSSCQGGLLFRFTGSTCAFEVDPLEPIPVYSAGGPNSVVHVTGSGILNVYEILVDGEPIFFKYLDEGLRFSYAPEAAGTVEVEFVGTSAVESAGLEVEYLDKPRIAKENRDGFENEFDVRIYGTPGTTALLLTSNSFQPSIIPGLINLSLGNNFTDIFSLGSAIIPANAKGDVLLPVGFPNALGTYVLQGITVGATQPIPSSNFFGILVVPN